MVKMEVGEKMYRMGEAAALLGVHQNTIRRWEKEGKIRVVRAPSGHRKIPESEVKRLLEPPSPQQQPSEPSREEKLKGFLDFVFTYCRDDLELVKKAVIIRDGFTCTRCGSKEMLNVHHLNGTARNDPENLTTLCQKCHESIHGKISPLPQPPLQVVSHSLDRQTILTKLAPVGMAQKTAYGELLSAAAAMKKFTAEELAFRTKTPKILAENFCRKMQELGYVKYCDTFFELTIEVIK
ncbi:MAG: MerR family DNA-binding transcriptional regulator [Candidatus Hadarchaeales archaeon]